MGIASPITVVEGGPTCGGNHMTVPGAGELEAMPKSKRERDFLSNVPERFQQLDCPLVMRRDGALRRKMRDAEAGPPIIQHF